MQIVKLLFDPIDRQEERAHRIVAHNEPELAEPIVLDLYGDPLQVHDAILDRAVAPTNAGESVRI